MNQLVDSFARKQIFRVDNRQEEQRSTKGQRQTTTMKAIKCLLLLAAALAFAAMNAAAMNAMHGDYYERLEEEVEDSYHNTQPYEAGANEDARSCAGFNHMGFKMCEACCIKLSWDQRKDWEAKEEAYKNFFGICVCRKRSDGPCPYTRAVYEAAHKMLKGSVHNPKRKKPKTK
jgi:hypothetical protein